eukprot:Em0005g1015a
MQATAFELSRLPPVAATLDSLHASGVLYSVYDNVSIHPPPPESPDGADPAASTMVQWPPPWPSGLNHGPAASTMVQWPPPWSSGLHHGPVASTMIQWPPLWSSGLHHGPAASTMAQWPPPWPSGLHHGLQHINPHRSFQTLGFAAKMHRNLF